MSIWNKEEKERKIEILNTNREVDILIIGAGITGLTTAYYLKDTPSISVVDASLYGHGVTLNTTAKITYLQQVVYTKIESLTNRKTATMYLKSQLEAIEYLKNIIEKEKIDCDLKKVPSYLFANTEKEISKVKKEVNFLKNNGIGIKMDELPNKITSHITYSVDDTYTFHPLKYLDGLYSILIESNISIYENSPILKVEQKDDFWYCYTDKNYIKAKKVIFACHYPFFIKPFFLPLKSSIEKSYIVISKVKQDLDYSCINSSNPVYSCRFYKDGENMYQISLAESHNTAIKQNDKEHFNRVKEIFQLKEKDILMSYSNVDIMTKDYMPYIGKIKENMYIATGFNTWGMTNGVLSAKILSDLVLNQKNNYIDIFKPNRLNMGTFIKTPYYLASQIKSFLGPKINKEKSWYNHVTFENRNGDSLGIYRDELGKKHVVYNKCPHFGCSLIFNEQEKTWDCPCHSSRFDIGGNCIKGPSNTSISYHENE